MALKYIIQLGKSQRLSVDIYSQVPPPTPRSCPLTEQCLGAGYVVTPGIEQAYTVSQAIHVHAYESCMHVGSALHFYYSLNIQNFNLTHSHVVCTLVGI